MEADEVTECSENELFDSLMKRIGSEGKYQARYNVLFNIFVPILISMPSMVMMVILNVPEHYCYVPGRELTNYTIEEWKNKTLPMENNPKTGLWTASSCKMFNLSTDVDLSQIDCEYGWEYDRTWHKETVVTKENWVCNKELHVTNAFVASSVGEVLGLFLFGQMSDKYGRKLVFIINLTVIIVGRLLLTFTSNYYYLFTAIIVFGNLSSTSLYQTPIIIGTEITSERKRTQVALFQSIGWVFGCSLLALISWLLKDWYWILLATTLPNLLIYLFLGFMPESPLWLASKGKVSKCLRVLKTIAKANGKEVPEDAGMVLRKIAQKKETLYGLATLFHKDIFWRTISLLTCWSVTVLAYYTLALFISNMEGNPHLNFLWQALVELPAYFLGNYLCDKIGRRLTQILSFSGVLLIYVLAIILHGYTIWGITIITGIAKMFVCISSYTMYMQSIEIYPTALRQSGVALGGAVGATFGTMEAYVVFLGSAFDGRLPFAVLILLASLGLIASLNIPETANRKLPVTLEEAKNFGKDQKHPCFKSFL